MTGLPRDAAGAAIPVLSPAPGLSQTITTGSASAVNVTPFDKKTKVIEVRATADCFIRLGTTNAVTALATDCYLPASETRTYSIQPTGDSHYDYLAAIQSTAAGTLYIQELQ